MRRHGEPVPPGNASPRLADRLEFADTAIGFVDLAAYIRSVVDIGEWSRDDGSQHQPSIGGARMTIEIKPVEDIDTTSYLHN